MDSKKGVIAKGVLIPGSLALIAGILAFSFFVRTSTPLAMQAQAAPLRVFCGPSHIPPGESWVLIGSPEELPEDLTASPAAAGVTVLELQKISKRAVGVRLEVSLGALGKLIRVSSASKGSEAYPDLYLGETPGSLTYDANFTPEDLVDGHLLLNGQYFMYGYYAATQVPLSATRIHNRSTGTWHSHDFAAEKVRIAKEVPIAVGPEFQAVDVFQTLPDTDGNGVPDFADVPEPEALTPEHLGVTLVPNANVLDLVASDEAGNTSWRIINVFTTYTP